MSPRRGSRVRPQGHAATERGRAAAATVIAAVNGFAFGGAANWPLPATFASRRRTHDSRNQKWLGIPPGWGGTQRLPALVGPGLAAEMIYTGRQVDAEEALRIGLVNAVHPLDQLSRRRESWRPRSRETVPLRCARKAAHWHDLSW